MGLSVLGNAGAREAGTLSANDQNMDGVIEELLDIWQENIRRHAIDHELLTPADILALLDPKHDAEPSS